MKREIEKIRLRTKLNECKHTYDTTMYPSQKEAAKNQYEALQEEHKALFGGYAHDFSLSEEKGNLSELEYQMLIALENIMEMLPKESSIPLIYKEEYKHAKETIKAARDKK